MVTIAEMLKYEAYKDSGLEKIGSIPCSWEVQRLKFLTSINSESLPDNTPSQYSLNYVDIGSVSFEKGIEKTEAFIFKDAPSRARRRARSGDVVVSTVRTYLKAIAYVDDEASKYTYSTGFAVVSPGEQLKSDYLGYFVKSNAFTEQVDLVAKGMSYPAINSTELSNLYLACAPADEQKLIANFLDKKTAQIDEAIAIKEQQIALLKERKQIIIQKAVTQGLDPKVPMKDSGVDWIGQIPEHWTTIKLKHATHLIQTGPFGTQLHAHDYVDSGVPLINPKHMNQGNITPEGNCTVDEKTAIRLSKYKLADGDLILARRGELGRCAVISKNEEGWLCGTGSLMLKPNKRIFDVRFLYTTISGNLVSEILSLDSVGSTMDNLNTSILGNLPLPLPNINEQSKIIKHIHELSINIDETASIQASQIEKLKEYKTTLINSAVTGKIKITPEMLEQG